MNSSRCLRAVQQLSTVSRRSQTILSPSHLHHIKNPLIYQACRAYSTIHDSHPKGTRDSVNAAEVSHFNALSSTWWDPHGPMRLLHLMNPLRHDFITSCRTHTHIIDGQPSSQPNKLRYIDVGCGGGIFAESAARLFSTLSVTGIDPSEEVIKVARRHAATDPALHSTVDGHGISAQSMNRSPGSSTRLEYISTGIENLPVPALDKDKADVLALWEVIEHVDNPDAFLRTCLPHVKPGGWLVLSTIARTYTSWVTTKVVAEDLMRIVPRGTHDWAKYINQEELRQWFERADGWAGEVGSVKVEGVVYVPALGWKMVPGAENWGNYFFGVKRDPSPEKV